MSIMEIAGILLFAVGAGYTAHQLHRDRLALNSDRRSVWKQQADLMKLREEENTKRMEIDTGFDWKSNLPMILSFLGGKGIDTSGIDMGEVENLISSMGDKE